MAGKITVLLVDDHNLVRRGFRRIKRVEDMGFDAILIGSQFGAIDEIERVRDFLHA